jgi:two-component sensor histidine kinase
MNRKIFWLLFLCMFYSVPRVLAVLPNLDSLARVTETLKNDTLKVNNLVLLSNKYRLVKMDYPQGIFYARKANELAKAKVYFKGIMMSDIALAYVYRDMGNREEGIRHLKLAIAGYKAVEGKDVAKPLRLNYVSACTGLSEILVQTLNFKDAQLYAFEALHFAERYGLNKGQSLNAIAFIFYRQKNFKEARKYTLLAVEEFKAIASLDDLGRAYSFLGGYANGEGNIDLAIYNYEQALAYYKRVPSVYGVRIALYNLGTLFLKQGAFERADSCVGEAMAISSKEDVIGGFYMRQLRAEVNLKRSFYKEAILYGTEALGYAKKMKSVKDLITIESTLYAAFSGNGDWKEASEIAKDLLVLKDSLYSGDISKNTQELMAKYEVEKKERAIAYLEKEKEIAHEKGKRGELLAEVLKKDNALQALRLEKETRVSEGLKEQNALLVKTAEQQRQLKWLIFLLFLGVVVFLGYYYRNYRIQKRDRAKIEVQAEKLNFMIQEMHHRIKNNLQVIVSMIRMQGRSLDDVNAQEVLQDAESRLQSILIVHERLYKDEMISQIKLNAYLRELVSVISHQYEDFGKEFKVHLIDEVEVDLHIDKAILLGLIVNELLSNAFKYAVVGGEGTKVRVSMLALGEGKYQVEVADNGLGLTSLEQWENPQRLGMRLVKLFAKQLRGDVSYNNDGGACFRLVFGVK